jgi:hypothetical protein
MGFQVFFATYLILYIEMSSQSNNKEHESFKVVGD